MLTTGCFGCWTRSWPGLMWLTAHSCSFTRVLHALCALLRTRVTLKSEDAEARRKKSFLFQRFFDYIAFGLFLTSTNLLLHQLQSKIRNKNIFCLGTSAWTFWWCKTFLTRQTCVHRSTVILELLWCSCWWIQTHWPMTASAHGQPHELLPTR